MQRSSFGYHYNGTPIIEILDSELPPSEHDFLVYVMGPYTAFNAEYLYDNAGNLKSPFVEDPLFDPNRHVSGKRGNYEKALAEFSDSLSSRMGIRAFIATDASIPTTKQAQERGLSEPGMTPVDQSVAFSAVSDAVMFIFSVAGRTTGVGLEVGAILGEFNLRVKNLSPPKKPRARFRLFLGPKFKSASFSEIPIGYEVDCIDFSSENELLNLSEQFLIGVERESNQNGIPIYQPTRS